MAVESISMRVLKGTEKNERRKRTVSTHPSSAVLSRHRSMRSKFSNELQRNIVTHEDIQQTDEHCRQHEAA
jgi:hypothetical protein